MEHNTLKEIKLLLKNAKELNKCLSKFRNEDIDQIFKSKANKVKEIKEHFLYTEEVLKNIVEHNHGT